MPNSFIFDPNRCTGCQACQLACTIENGLAPTRSWRRIETFNPRRLPGVPLVHLSLACNHCSEPACMYACPAAAYSRDPSMGAVLLHEDKCIGCRYCSWACPYDAPVFDDVRGVMSKCTFCNHRLRDGLKPACASLCPTGALDFGDVPEEDLVHEIGGFPDTDLEPWIRIAPLKAGRRLPVMAAAELSDPYQPRAQESPSEISLASEWSLLGFTSMAAILVALVASTPKMALSLSPVVFAAAGALTMGLAALHLGKPGRAYRAVLNLRRSWLSREVLSLSTFFALATGYLWLTPGNRALGGAAAAVGLLGLLCADQVYGVLGRSRPAYRHSASVLWTGFFLTGVFTATPWLAGVFGFGKLALYISRKLEFIDAGRRVRPVVSAVRLSIGLVTPFVLWWVDLEALRAYVIAAVILGEFIDRAEYYDELERETPRGAMADELRRQIAGRASEPGSLAALRAD